jgi:hypothetical protein
MENKKNIYALFVVGQLITFLFIILLQLLSRDLFLILLVSMHIGIVLIIISKKSFLKLKLNIKIYYKRLYLLLTPFLPMVFYKLLSYIFSYEVNKSFVFLYTMIVAAVTFSIAILNSIHLYRFIHTKK